LIPGFGMVTAFKDAVSAGVAASCYRAVMQTMENAEAVGTFRFLPERQVFAFEHWPLERRKIAKTAEEEADRLLLPRRIALIIGAGSGIGEAAAWRFCREGAHLVVADLDGEKTKKLAAALNRQYPQRAVGVSVDACREESLAQAVRAAVLAFGGLDILFYTAGRAPRFRSILEISREDLETQLQVHYTGAVLAIREAGRILKRQGRGGSILCSVSKAALAPGRQAAAYGGSKAAILQALRIAALELGPQGIRVNAINADQVETPLFMRFAAARARAQGRSLEEQLEQYRRRNAMGVTRIPPRAVADLAVLLASDRFRYTTGDILTIDGGLPEAFPR
ncbi:MAG: SDR family oxidoreductase, partial [Acidobacteriota bacterium]